MSQGDRRVAVVTGANRGIGLEVVHQLAQDGFTAILGARDLGRGAAAAGPLRAGGLDVEPRQLDVADPASVAAFAAELEREWAYGQIYGSSAERTAQLPRWLDHYNYKRPHGALGHNPPGSRLNNLVGNYI